MMHCVPSASLLLLFFFLLSTQPSYQVERKTTTLPTRAYDALTPLHRRSLSLAPPSGLAGIKTTPLLTGLAALCLCSFYVSFMYVVVIVLV